MGGGRDGTRATAAADDEKVAGADRRRGTGRAWEEAAGRVKPTAIDARVSRRRYAPGGMARAERPSRPRTEAPAPRDEIVVALSAQKVFALLHVFLLVLFRLEPRGTACARASRRVAYGSARDSSRRRSRLSRRSRARGRLNLPPVRLVTSQYASSLGRARRRDGVRRAPDSHRTVRGRGGLSVPPHADARAGV